MGCIPHKSLEDHTLKYLTEFSTILVLEIKNKHLTPTAVIKRNYMHMELM